MAWFLDVESANAAGSKIPTAGVFRGERVEIIGLDGQKATVRLPHIPQKDQLFEVDLAYLTSDGEDD